MRNTQPLCCRLSTVGHLRERSAHSQTTKGNGIMKEAPSAEPSRNVKDQIGYCGLWCGSCVVGNGTLRELTRRYKELIKAYGLEAWAPKAFDFREFAEGLSSIQSMPLCPGCLEGGGGDGCKMRLCASSKSIDDCSQCDEQATCEHTEALQRMRSGALDAGMLVKTQDVDRSSLIEDWTTGLKSRWPCCILYVNSQSDSSGCRE